MKLATVERSNKQPRKASKTSPAMVAGWLAGLELVVFLNCIIHRD